MTRISTRSNHLFDIESLSRETITTLLKRAKYWESEQENNIFPLHNCFVANLFFEPSTRTRFSFEVAEKRLGMHIIHFEKSKSSIKKGESLYDTVKTLSSIGVEAVVIRHPEADAISNLLKQDIGCTILNAGAGIVAHPTQALVDLYTIHKHFGRLEGLQVAIVGDVEHSRVARSNLSILKKFGVRVVLCGPTAIDDLDICREVPFLFLDEVLSTIDVIMLLRVQFERHERKGLFDADNYLHHYGLTIRRFNQLKSDAIIMHPGPVNQGIEISGELVQHPRSKIFEQMENGVFIRMAALEYALGVL